eukprot:TRINITY_DN4902_c0_g1_i3.p1 TRINITY_DN4902_c0_g1~~TRINITY_DN4902_c0_g1_i3.p1  ORF type:complete len:107 (-),score=38.61 TRINITY_DN4902_c0_g1_i3:313-588(-)
MVDTNNDTIKSNADNKKKELPPHPMTDPQACKEFKDKHDACFYKWYSDKFLKGKSMELECKDEWEEYQMCIKDKLKAWNLEYLLHREQNKK